MAREGGAPARWPARSMGLGWLMVALLTAACDDEAPLQACDDSAECPINAVCVGMVCGPVDAFDGDDDGLPDVIEALVGTAPDEPDTDGDGASDGEEVTWQTGTRLFDAPDEDGDGRIDALESNTADADGDTVSDQADPCDDDPTCPASAAPPCRAAEGEACAVGVGVCTELGMTICTADGQGVECVGEPGQPSDEACNGLDDDCDGVVDEAFADLGEACTDGANGCRVDGVMECAADGSGSTCSARAPEAMDERCNGADDDCDGEVDEAFTDLGFVCELGLGECNVRGVFECNRAGDDVRCGVMVPAGVDELCDGLDNDCDGRIDETFSRVGQACEVGDGGCIGRGVWRCSPDGADTACDAEPAEPQPERCNEVDDDCDGETDEGFDDLGAPCEAGVGACVRQGGLVCDPDSDGYVCGAVPGRPDAERCDQIDNDCDGLVDEDFDELGEACAAGDGVCRAEGTFVCDLLTGEPRCTARPLPPREEVCNEVDDDCDGEADEAFPDLGTPCAAGVGACQVEGVVVCGRDPRTTACSAEAEAGAGERCNGADDDCDGETDEGFDLGAACMGGLGPCARPGVRVCGPEGEAVCDAVPGPPGVESCDGTDEDCDGTADEDFVARGLGEGCVAGRGACAVEGQWLCTDDGADIRCDAEPGEPGEERCNALDDDCDGRFDEAFFTLGARCSVGEGICLARGSMVCAPGGDDTVCGATPGEPDDERCNRVDDDCDGEADEGFDVGEPCAVGQGVCFAEGVIACAGGAAACTAEAGDPAPEACNQLDDDCDGETDEGFGPGCERLLVEVSVGGYHTCARQPDDLVICWGQIDPPPLRPMATLAAGPDWHCGLDAIGEAACWGDGPAALFEVPPGAFDALALGTAHACGIRPGGLLACWGVDTSGETRPPPVAFSAVSAGPSVTCGVERDTGALRCFGADDNGRGSPPDGVYTALSVGSEHGCALSQAGEIRCWGADSFGRLDAPMGAWAEVAAGGFHTCARPVDGPVVCWGAGGPEDPDRLPHFEQSLPPDAELIELGAGEYHTCGRTPDSVVLCWGAGNPETLPDGFINVGQATVP